MADDIDINVVVTGKEDLKSLSVTLRNLLLATKDMTGATKNLDARQRAINTMFGAGQKHAGDYAKSLRETVTNQKILGAEIQKTTDDMRRLNSIMRSGGGSLGMQGLAKNLDQSTKALKSAKVRMLAADLRSVGIEMKRLGKDAQFVGRNLIIGLTTPLIAFGREGLQNFYAIEKQLVRLKKLMGESNVSAGELGEKVQQLADSATDLSYEFGIAKELILAVSGDFAELGINVTENIEKLTRLTAEFAVLGDMDVSAAQDLTQTLYLGSLNALEMTKRMREFTSAADAQAYAIENVTSQMYMFNSIENATALSMREIAATLPEISAAGQTFGLNFNEMLSFLAPMKAIGIDVNAAATGIKVSFQKLVNPTIKMQKELQRLSDAAREVGDIALSEDFLGIQNIGMESIQSLVDVTNSFIQSGNDEQILKFYAQLFDDRQSTRMLAALRDLANFQNAMFRTSVDGAASAEKRFVDEINRALDGTGMLVNDIKSLSQVTQLANVSFQQLSDSGTIYIKSLGREVTRAEIQAAKDARKQLQQFIRDEADAGRNAIEDMTSEAGKTLAINFAGASSAMELAIRELDAAKQSTSASIDRIKIAFKNLTTTFINDLAPVIRWVSEKFMELVKTIQNLPPEFRTVMMVILGLAASLGPLVFIFGQFKLGFGVMLEGVMRLVPGLKLLELQSISTNSGLLYLKKGLTMQGEAVVNLNSRFATLIGTLATGDGRIARMARSFGQMTGVLNKNKTAAADLMGAMERSTPKGDRALRMIFAKALGQKAGATTAATSAPVAQIKMTAEEAVDSILRARNQSAKELDTILSKKTAKTLKDMGLKSGELLALPKFVPETGNFRNLKGQFVKLNQLEMTLMQLKQSARIKAENEYQEELRQTLLLAQSLYRDKRGITLDAGGSSMYGGRKISERQERAIIRGGLRGAATKIGTRIFGSADKAAPSAVDFLRTASGANALKKAVDSMKGSSGVFGSLKAGVLSLGDSFRSTIPSASSMRSAITSIGGATKTGIFKVTGIQNFINSIGAAKNAVTALNTQYAIMGMTGPSIMSKMTTGMMAFTKSILSASKAFKILKLAMLSTGILAIVLAIAAVVVYLINVFRTMGEKSTTVANNFKNAWNAIKGAIQAVIKPIRDTVATLAQMISGAQGGADGTIGAFERISIKIADIAQAIAGFIKDYIVPVIEFIMVNVIDFIRAVVRIFKAVIAIFKGNWGDALQYIGEALAMLLRIAIDLLKGFAKIGIEVFGAIAKGMVSAFANGFNKVADMVTAMAGQLVKWGSSIAGGPLGFALEKMFGLSDKLFAIEKPFDGIANAAKGVIDSVTNVSKGVVDSIGDTVMGWIDDLVGGRQQIIDGAGDDLLKDTEKELEEGSDDLFDPFINAGGEAGGEAGSAAGKEFNDAFADALKDLQQKFVDLVLDSLKSAVDEASSELEKALEKQKEQALAVYDAQVEALEKLEKAEESLTREKEYQLERRKMLDERELQRTNYIRNRALAIYEGRIDDARMLSLQEQADQRDFNQGITKLDDARRKDLISENLEALRDAIEKTKEETAKLIEEQIEKFQEAAKEITKFPPLTIEEYSAQLQKLNEVATSIAGENGNILKTMMDSMAVNLVMPNENLGVFSTGLDKLVEVAQQKYGLLGSPGKDTIVGATIGMIAGINGQFIENRSKLTNSFQGIIDNVFDVASTLSKLSGDVVSPALESIIKVIVDKNPFKVFEQAVKDANETILREMQKTVGHVASIVNNITSHINKALIELTRLQVAAQQAGQQTPATGGGGGGGGGGSGGSTGGPSLPAQPALPQTITAMVSKLVGPTLSGTADTKARYLQQAVSIVTSLLKQSLSMPDPAAYIKNKVDSINQAGQSGAWPDSAIVRTLGYYGNRNHAVSLAKAGKFYKGGFVTPGMPSTPVPAILHGGEFVVSSKAVSNIGLAALTAMNNMRYMTPGGLGAMYGGGQGGAAAGGYSSSKTENINIYVENFIGEDEWFNSMLKKYNMNVLPRNQKAAGMENRVVTTYTGLSRGM